MNIEKLINKVKDYLNNDEEHVDKKVDMILFNKEKNEYGIYVSDYDEIGYLTYKDNKLSECITFFDWEFSVDEYIFDDLESGYEFEYITENVHNGIWFEVNTYSIEDIQHREGFNKYLGYCKENGITAEYLNEHVNNSTSVSIPNIYDNKYLFPENLER